MRLGLAERARRAEQVAAHEVDVVAHVSRAKLGVEEPVHLLVLRERDARRVRLVEERHPESAIPSTVIRSASTSAKRDMLASANGTPLPCQVMLIRGPPVGQRNRPIERRHPVGERPFGRVEEDADERARGAP